MAVGSHLLANSCFQIALVAHDGKKEALQQFLLENIHFFRDRNIVATGHTGKQLVEALANSIRSDERGMPAEAVPDEELVKQRLGIQVEAVEHGPNGGDAVIGMRTEQGKIQGIFFYVNPDYAQPHADDIRAFIRTANRNEVPLALNPATTNWIMAGTTREKETAPRVDGGDGQVISMSADLDQMENLVHFVKLHWSYLKDRTILASGPTADRLSALGLKVERGSKSEDGGNIVTAGTFVENPKKVKAVFLFRDPKDEAAGLVRDCIVKDIPLATNFGTARFLITGLERAAGANISLSIPR